MSAGPPGVEVQLADLTARLGHLEDLLAITQLIAAYGPLVDSGAAEQTAALWTDDGVYDVDTGRMDGAGAVTAMVDSQPHQRLIARGCAHLLAPPHVVVEGDRAIAVGVSQLIRHHDGGFEVLRLTANRWELARQANGWRVTRRTSRLLDGAAQARALLESRPG